MNKIIIAKCFIALGSKTSCYVPNMKYIFVIFLSLFSINSFANDKAIRMDMEGILKIWGKKSADTEMSGLSLFINGEAAKQLYKTMKVKAIHNECYDDGTLTKYLGSFECSYSEKYQYSCSVGIGLKEQKLFYGESC